MNPLDLIEEALKDAEHSYQTGSSATEALAALPKLRRLVEAVGAWRNLETLDEMAVIAAYDALTEGEETP